MVRGNAADDELEGINQIQEGIDAINFGQPFFEFGSEVRERADDDGVFERTILRDAPILNNDELNANVNVFAQLKANQSMDLVKNGIEFEGFGLTFSAPEDEEELIKGGAKSAKKRDKLRKDFEKMVLASDANINSVEIYKALKQPAKADFTSL
jgi:hypothetical protein